jgi:hypothetical protein
MPVIAATPSAMEARKIANPRRPTRKSRKAKRKTRGGRTPLRSRDEIRGKETT